MPLLVHAREFDGYEPSVSVTTFDGPNSLNIAGHPQGKRLDRGRLHIYPGERKAANWRKNHARPRGGADSGADWNKEVFPVIQDLRDVLINEGLPITESQS